MTPEDLAAIKARAEKATPGPWCFSGKDWGNVLSSDGYVTEQIGETCISYRDGDFIAHARTDVPALVTEVELLRQALADLAPRKHVCGQGVADCAATFEGGICDCGADEHNAAIENVLRGE